MQASTFSRNIASMAAVVLLLVLGACTVVTNSPQEDGMPVSADRPPAKSSNGDQPAPVATADARRGPTDEGDHDVPEDVIVSTNEPFWSARVEDDEVSLTGVDHPERRLPVVASEVMPHAAAMARRIHARGESVDLVIEVRAEPCQDSMSGAQYPLSASLSFDGSDPVEGCARPASMPIPPAPAD